jgi:hypothetical protein
MGQFASSELRRPNERELTFRVSAEVVEQNLDWSRPVRFKFDKHGDGTVTMWLQNVEQS